MVDNSTIGGLGLAGSAGGAVLGAFGSVSSGLANKQMSDYQSGIAKLNAQIDLQNAKFARDQGEQQSQIAGMKQASQYGQIIASQASSGFDVNSGSNKQVQNSQRTINALDTSIIRSDAAKTAYGFEIKASQDMAQASVDKMAGANSFAAGLMGAGTSILSGASSVSSEWMQGMKVGLWGQQNNNPGGSFGS